jgi:hypothetical protein
MSLPRRGRGDPDEIMDAQLAYRNKYRTVDDAPAPSVRKLVPPQSPLQGRLACSHG